MSLKSQQDFYKELDEKDEERKDLVSKAIRLWEALFELRRG